VCIYDRQRQRQLSYVLLSIQENSFKVQEKRKCVWFYQKHWSVSLSQCIDHSWLGIQFITSLTSNLCTDLSRLNTVENLSITLDTHYAAELQPSAFLTGIFWLLVMNV
jgi:hypothetical protein